MQAAAPFTPVTFAEVAATESTLYVPVCRRSGAHSSAVRPYPANFTSWPAVGAVVARAAGATSVTGRFSLARTTSRSVRGTSSTTRRSAPWELERLLRPTTAVIAFAGAPGVTASETAGSAAKQLAAVSSHSLSTRTAEQPRSCGPTMSWAV